MSRQIGMDAICCRRTPRPAHVEYSMEHHGSLVRKITGVQVDGSSASKDAADYEVLPREILRKFYDALDYDFTWGTHDGFVDWAKAGRCTDMGHASYVYDGSDQRSSAESPFKEPEEVWAFDPVKEYGVTPFDQLVEGYEKHY